jgi:hypothetical protein
LTISCNVNGLPYCPKLVWLVVNLLFKVLFWIDVIFIIFKKLVKIFFAKK